MYSSDTVCKLVALYCTVLVYSTTVCQCHRVADTRDCRSTCLPSASHCAHCSVQFTVQTLSVQVRTLPSSPLISSFSFVSFASLRALLSVSASASASGSRDRSSSLCSHCEYSLGVADRYGIPRAPRRVPVSATAGASVSAPPL